MTKKNILIFFDSKEKELKENLILYLKQIDYKTKNIDLIIIKDDEFQKQIPKKINVQEITISKNKIIKKIQSIIIKIKYIFKNKKKYNKSILFSINSNIGNYIVRKSSNNSQVFIYEKIKLLDLEYREYFIKKNIYEFQNIVFKTYEEEYVFLKYFPTLSKKTSVINLLINNEEIEKLSKEKITEKIKKTYINILLIEELNEEKNKTLEKIKLIQSLINDFPKLNLYIIGEGIDKYAYETYIEDNKLEKNIFLIGKKKNVYPYIEKCKYIFLFTKEQIEKYLYASLTLNTQVISKCSYTDNKIKLGETFGYIISSNINKQKDELLLIFNSNKKHTKYKKSK